MNRMAVLLGLLGSGAPLLVASGASAHDRPRAVHELFMPESWAGQWRLLQDEEGLRAAACLPVARQEPPQFDMAIRTTRITDRVYLLEGAGGNVAAFLWDEGVLLVDDKLAPAGPEVKAAIAAITSKPIRLVVNSHWHPDHRGGNESLAGDGSVIVAHENVRRRMSVGGFVAVFDRKLPAAPASALPVVTFTRDVTFHLGGEEISVLHVERAHTDGDSFVLFSDANVLHMGDCYLNGSFPVVDYSSGGVPRRDVAMMRGATTRCELQAVSVLRRRSRRGSPSWEPTRPLAAVAAAS